MQWGVVVTVDNSLVEVYINGEAKSAASQQNAGDWGKADRFEFSGVPNSGVLVVAIDGTDAELDIGQGGGRSSPR